MDIYKEIKFLVEKVIVHCLISGNYCSHDYNDPDSWDDDLKIYNKKLSLREYIDIKTKICYDCYIEHGVLDSFYGIGKIGIVDAVNNIG